VDGVQARARSKRVKRALLALGGRPAWTRVEKFEFKAHRWTGKKLEIERGVFVNSKNIQRNVSRENGSSRALKNACMFSGKI